MRDLRATIDANTLSVKVDGNIITFDYEVRLIEVPQSILLKKNTEVG